MATEAMHVRQAEQAMEEPGIPQIYFGRFALAFANVLVPRLQLPDYKSSWKIRNINPNFRTPGNHGLVTCPITKRGRRIWRSLSPHPAARRGPGPGAVWRTGMTGGDREWGNVRR